MSLGFRTSIYWSWNPENIMGTLSIYDLRRVQLLNADRIPIFVTYMTPPGDRCCVLSWITHDRVNSGSQVVVAFGITMPSSSGLL
jgi:hypothetical protein